MKMSEKLLRLRTDADMTQAEFAKIAGVSDKAVSAWEREGKTPRLSSVKKLCTHFGIDVHSFIDEDSDVYAPATVSIETEAAGVFKQLTPANKKVAFELLQSFLKSQESNADSRE